MQAKQHDRHKNQSMQASKSISSAVATAEIPVLGGNAFIGEVLSNQDIWVHRILPFLGPGHFLYVALVCKMFKQYYLEFFSKIKDLPLVVEYGEYESWQNYDFYSTSAKHPTVPTHTSYGAAFSSVSRAKFWYKITKNVSNQLGGSRLCATVATHGNLQVLKWARLQGFRWCGLTCYKAAYNGHLEVLKYAHEDGCPYDEDTETCEAAAENGHLECLKYLHDTNCPWDDFTCQSAAKNGHLEVLKYAHENGCPWDEATCYEAAERGHLEVLQYAHDNKCPWCETTCYNAAMNGHLQCLKYAIENGCPCEDVCYTAAGKGDLEMLKYAHQNQPCPWDEFTPWYAAKNGHLGCLKYAHEEQCPWHSDTCYVAAGGGHLECLKYAHENNCPWSWQGCISRAAAGGHLEILKWARDNPQCPWDEEQLEKIRFEARRNRSQEVLDWLNGLNQADHAY